MNRSLKSCSATMLMVILLSFFVRSAWAVDVQMIGDVNVSGDMTATSFTGSGVGLTGIPGTAISSTSITVNQLADDAVTSTKIANDAVTPAKIAFYSRLAIVATSGGDYNNPATAMTNYSTWCASTPCLLKIMPGVYDVGTTAVQMQSNIDIEGSGEGVTIITGMNGSGLTGVVRGANSTELRHITIQHAGSVNSAVGIYNSFVSPTMSNVTVRVSGGIYNYGVYNTSSALKMTNVTTSATGTNTNYAVYNSQCTRAMTMTNVSATSLQGAWNFGVYNNSASPVMTDVDATSIGGTESYGVYNVSSSPLMINVRAVASGAVSNYGIYNNSSAPDMTRVQTSGNTGTYSYGLYNSASSGTYTIYIDQSSFEGVPNSIYNDTEYTLYIGASKLRGPVNSVGTYHCVGVYAGTTYTALGANCQ